MSFPGEQSLANYTKISMMKNNKKDSLRGKNCWEVKQCGCEPGGVNVRDGRPCPAAVDTRFNAINDGKNGGRICWAVPGTFCYDGKKRSFAEKLTFCVMCDFYRRVKLEEQHGFQLDPGVKPKLKQKVS